MQQAEDIVKQANTVTMCCHDQHWGVLIDVDLEYVHVHI